MDIEKSIQFLKANEIVVVVVGVILIGLILQKLWNNSEKKKEEFKQKEISEADYIFVKEWMAEHAEVKSKGKDFMEKGFITNAEKWELGEIAEACNLQRLKNTLKN